MCLILYTLLFNRVPDVRIIEMKKYGVFWLA
jgi:hypothetical protein